MKRIVFAVLVSVLASYQAQASCDTNLTLICQATFLSAGKGVVTGTALDGFVDEHWDEPSLANCAATVYLTNVNNTSVRVYAQIEGSQVAIDSVAVQTYRDDQNQMSAYYSNTVNATQAVGAVNTVGVLKLANPVSYGTQMIMIDNVAVACQVK